MLKNEQYLIFEVKGIYKLSANSSMFFYRTFTNLLCSPPTKKYGKKRNLRAGRWEEWGWEEGEFLVQDLLGVMLVTIRMAPYYSIK